MKAKKNKYDKSLRYLQHDELDGIMAGSIENGLSFSMKVMILIAVLALFRGDNELYPGELIPIDAAFTLSIILFKLIKPLLYNGTINAYYRRSYRTVSMFIKSYAWIASGCVLRLAVTKTIFFFNAYHGDYTKAEFTRRIAGMYHTTITPVVLTLSAILLYFCFFSDRYVSIKEFSNRVVTLMKKDLINRNVAMAIVKNLKDIEYGISSYDDIYYTEEEKPYQNFENIGDIIERELNNKFNA